MAWFPVCTLTLIFDHCSSQVAVLERGWGWRAPAGPGAEASGAETGQPVWLAEVCGREVCGREVCGGEVRSGEVRVCVVERCVVERYVVERCVFVW